MKHKRKTYRDGIADSIEIMCLASIVIPFYMSIFIKFLIG